jgi:hypothetical protein
MVSDGDLHGKAQLAFGDLQCLVFALLVDTSST